MEKKKLWLFILQMAPVFLKVSRNAQQKQNSHSSSKIPLQQKEFKVITWKNIAKFVVVVSSFTGFFYQSSEYFIEFFSFPTAVLVTTERITIIVIPSVTICVPSLTSRPLLERAYPELRDTILSFNSSENDPLISTTLLYAEYENLSASDKSPQEFFELGLHADEIIECKVLRPMYYRTTLETWIPCSNVSKVLETIGPNGKCFTYFTLLNHNETDNYEHKFKIDINQSVRNEAGLIISIKLTFNQTTYIDSAKIGDESITLHESTAIPSEGKKRRLRPGVDYDIFFTKTNTTYLPQPYTTKCKAYQVFNRNEPQSRIDCVDRCIKDIYYKDCHCYPLHVVVRQDIVTLIEKKMHMCNDTNVDLAKCKKKEVNSDCLGKCALDCEEIVYDFDTEEDNHSTDRHMPDERRAANISHIRLWRKVSGDTLYVHTAKLPLIQLFSFVGGLASLWLGISIIAFYDILVKIVTFIYKTKPFEKMRRRDAAVSVLTNWGNNVRLTHQVSVATNR